MSLILILTFLSALLSMAMSAELHVLTVANFEDKTQASTGATTGPWLVKFYAPWCGHCKTLAPVFDELPIALADEAGQAIVNVAKVDVTANQNLGQRFEIRGFPTIKLLKDGKQYTFKGRRDVETIKTWALGGYATQSAEEVKAPLGVLGEIKYAFTELWSLAKKDFNAKKYFTQHTIIVALPVIFVVMLVAILVLPDPSPAAPVKAKQDSGSDYKPTGGDLTIKYGDVVVDNTGKTEIAPSKSIKAPIVQFNAEEGQLYTLIMTDPDAPSTDEPIFREYIHWVVVNIKNGDIATGEVALPYVGPGPPYKSGKHRYVFMLFKQGSASVNVAQAQAHFKERAPLFAQNWADSQFSPKSRPEVKVFSSEWDESVDALHASMDFVPPEKYRSPSQQKKSEPKAAGAKKNE